MFHLKNQDDSAVKYSIKLTAFLMYVLACYTVLSLIFVHKTKTDINKGFSLSFFFSRHDSWAHAIFAKKQLQKLSSSINLRKWVVLFLSKRSKREITVSAT